MINLDAATSRATPAPTPARATDDWATKWLDAKMPASSAEDWASVASILHTNAATAVNTNDAEGGVTIRWLEVMVRMYARAQNESG